MRFRPTMVASAWGRRPWRHLLDSIETAKPERTNEHYARTLHRDEHHRTGAGRIDRRGDVQVSAVHLKLGALSGVVKEALLGSFEMACEDTPLKGARLVVEERSRSHLLPESARRSVPSVPCNYFVVRNAALHQPKLCRERNSKWLHLEIEEWDHSPV